MSQRYPVHLLKSHFLEIHFNIILPPTPVFPSGFFPSGFPTKTLYAPLLSPTHATCPTHLVPLDLITRTILGEQYRSLSSSLRSLPTSLLFFGKYLSNVYYSTIYTWGHQVFFFFQFVRLNKITRRKINKNYVFWFQFPVKCGTRTPVGLQGCTFLAVSTWLLSVLIEATLSRHIRESASGGDDRKQRAGCSLQADMQYLCNVIVSQITPPPSPPPHPRNKPTVT